MDDHRQADLSAAERSLVAYAVKLTASPQAMTKADVGALRRAGYDDAAILAATHIIGYFNHINRLADALGIDLEPEWDEQPPWTPARD